MAPPATARQQVRLFAPSEERRRSLDVIGAQPYGMRDLYHSLLAASWTRVTLMVTFAFLAINAAFGLAFQLVGGVYNARADSFADHFFFSVQTLATIGYGAMYPQSTAAEWLMTAEALTSLFLNAFVTGLAFARFARPTARATWSKVACVCNREGVPTLIIRVANERMNHVVDATMKVAVIREEVTKEGERVRRVIDMPLLRSTSPSFILTWLVMHPITKDSPLYGFTPEKLAETQSEIIVTFTGLDETLGQTIHSRTSYLAEEVRFGQRFVDVILWDQGAQRRQVDLRKFHDTTQAPLDRAAMGLP